MTPPTTPHNVPPPAGLPPRLLCGPGPSNVHPAVYAAMARPITGHLDPAFLHVMDEIAAMLRVCFGTSNPLTFAVSGTGSAGMEAALVNMIEPSDTAVVCVNGVFGERMCEVARRSGANVVRVDAPWGETIDPGAVADTLRTHPGARVLGVVHAETSTGVLADVAAVAAAARAVEPEVCIVVDAVTSLAGIEVTVDAWGADVCYSGTQKCLSVPPGLAPITFSRRATDRLARRATPVRSWYLDVTLIARYLDAATRAYHHTAPVSMLLGLHAGLRVVLQEGLQARAERHWAAGRALQSALASRGYRLLAAEDARLPQLTAVVLPDGVDERRERRRLLEVEGIEVGGGLGEYAGKMWRIGLMGENARGEIVERLLASLP